MNNNDLEIIDLSGLNGLSSQDLTTISPAMLPSLSTIDLSGLTTSTISAQGAVGQGYTINGGSFAWQTPNVWTTTTATSTAGTTVGQKGQLSLHGEEADIHINGKSMKAWMEKVEERLNILTPNTELEKDWDDLRKLGERYRRLEKKCKEKAETWKKLKAMPPPRVD